MNRWYTIGCGAERRAGERRFKLRNKKNAAPTPGKDRCHSRIRQAQRQVPVDQLAGLQRSLTLWISEDVAGSWNYDGVVKRGAPAGARL